MPDLRSTAERLRRRPRNPITPAAPAPGERRRVLVRLLAAAGAFAGLWPAAATLPVAAHVAAAYLLFAAAAALACCRGHTHRAAVDAVVDVTALTVLLHTAGTAGAWFLPALLLALAEAGMRLERGVFAALTGWTAGAGTLCWVLGLPNIPPAWSGAAALCVLLAGAFALHHRGWRAAANPENAEWIAFDQRRLMKIQKQIGNHLYTIARLSDRIGGLHPTGHTRELAERLQQAVNALSLTADNVLLALGQHSRALIPPVTDFSLQEVLESVQNTMRPRAQARRLLFSVHVLPEIPDHLRGRPAYLQQILLNLLDNAIRYTEQGEVELRIYDISDGEAPVRLRFEVIDTGAGLPIARNDTASAVLTDLKDWSGTRSLGCGLGIPVAKRLVQVLGGHLGGHSVSQVGTTVWFELEFEKPLREPASRLPEGVVALPRHPNLR